MSLFGPQELLLIFGIIIILFGATKLPELARSLGQSMGEFKVGQMEAERRYEALKNQPISQTPDDIALTRAQRMAKNLGIDIKGKTDEQLLAEIEKKLAEQEAALKR
ncbi:Sec-independent protein translocase TatA [Methanocella conradii HZ254]|uniref:Sec-independent protein translocase protein TatA n=1 Tax=Methanocella conradii (strain DSM 24694 / JCM 17849 / CGMCC 1.5162 / HZ254) TaxID=1041930 RepID=H8I6K2_METCZ|nr:twin-arginine translocase TatA/TatE family subunit [Methanocella conradii]AFC98894.1 Sec-independent protein translocase TatA [Methanocella conradii HZ254]MDI6897228.1 twin-arginine translocase TatA/TatE family subunit [Methanocella conradii]